jgi:hypothetical protein
MSPILSSRFAAIILIIALVLPVVFLHESPRVLANSNYENTTSAPSFVLEPPVPYLAPSALNSGMNRGYFSSYLYSSADRLKKMFASAGLPENGFSGSTFGQPDAEEDADPDSHAGHCFTHEHTVVRPDGPGLWRRLQ